MPPVVEGFNPFSSLSPQISGGAVEGVNPFLRPQEAPEGAASAQSPSGAEPSPLMDAAGEFITQTAKDYIPTGAGVMAGGLTGAAIGGPVGAAAGLAVGAAASYLARRKQESVLHDWLGSEIESPQDSLIATLFTIPGIGLGGRSVTKAIEAARLPGKSQTLGVILGKKADWLRREVESSSRKLGEEAFSGGKATGRVVPGVSGYSVNEDGVLITTKVKSPKTLKEFGDMVNEDSRVLLDYRDSSAENLENIYSQIINKGSEVKLLEGKPISQEEAGRLISVINSTTSGAEGEALPGAGAALTEFVSSMATPGRKTIKDRMTLVSAASSALEDLKNAKGDITGLDKFARKELETLRDRAYQELQADVSTLLSFAQKEGIRTDGLWPEMFRELNSRVSALTGLRKGLYLEGERIAGAVRDFDRSAANRYPRSNVGGALSAIGRGQWGQAIPSLLDSTPRMVNAERAARMAEEGEVLRQTKEALATGTGSLISPPSPLRAGAAAAFTGDVNRAMGAGALQTGAEQMVPQEASAQPLPQSPLPVEGIPSPLSGGAQPPQKEPALLKRDTSSVFATPSEDLPIEFLSDPEMRDLIVEGQKSNPVVRREIVAKMAQKMPQVFEVPEQEDLSNYKSLVDGKLMDKLERSTYSSQLREKVSGGVDDPSEKILLLAEYLDALNKDGTLLELQKPLTLNRNPIPEVPKESRYHPMNSKPVESLESPAPAHSVSEPSGSGGSTKKVEYSY